ncbi:sugar isomerase domain-containing protein [Embleya scabrispora]|uniref:sugar isomerase domain-containing protein n=1 Tax=Embleya scabrispora TaxID=159449 RepID=UPI0003808257|nr:SIS domain-containing protein [Embleya scabrispora]MYS80298.1 sugar isomerase domain-containing protein [Streptomyces sp. SID5474]
MVELGARYLDAAIALLERLRDEELPTIDRAADRVAEALAAGGRLFVFGGGHSALAAQDVIYRAGGLILANPLIAPGNELTVRPITVSTAVEKLAELAGPVLDGAGLREGDVLVVISLSGRNGLPVEIARRARERGTLVVGVTSIVASEAESPRHPSGTRVLDNCDIVLDTAIPPGDAALEADGVPQRIGPTSGVVCSAVLQTLMVGVIGHLVSRGIEPPVFMSANVEGGAAWNERLLAEHADRIFYLR